jgi:hypothetical protein
MLRLPSKRASATTTGRYIGATPDLDDSAVDWAGLRVLRPLE